MTKRIQNAECMKDELLTRYGKLQQQTQDAIAEAPDFVKQLEGDLSKEKLRASELKREVQVAFRDTMHVCAYAVRTSGISSRPGQVILCWFPNVFSAVRHCCACPRRRSPHLHRGQGTAAFRACGTLVSGRASPRIPWSVAFRHWVSKD